MTLSNESNEVTNQALAKFSLKEDVIANFFDIGFLCIFTEMTEVVDMVIERNLKRKGTLSKQSLED